MANIIGSGGDIISSSADIISSSADMGEGIDQKGLIPLFPSKEQKLQNKSADKLNNLNNISLSKHKELLGFEGQIPRTKAEFISMVPPDKVKDASEMYESLYMEQLDQDVKLANQRAETLAAGTTWDEDFSDTKNKLKSALGNVAVTGSEIIDFSQRLSPITLGAELLGLNPDQESFNTVFPQLKNYGQELQQEAAGDMSDYYKEKGRRKAQRSEVRQEVFDAKQFKGLMQQGAEGKKKLSLGEVISRDIEKQGRELLETASDFIGDPRTAALETLGSLDSITISGLASKKIFKESLKNATQKADGIAAEKFKESARESAKILKTANKEALKKADVPSQALNGASNFKKHSIKSRDIELKAGIKKELNTAIKDAHKLAGKKAASGGLAAGAIYTGGSNSAQIKQEIDDTPKDKIEESPKYKELVESGEYSKKGAYNKLKNDAGDITALLTGVGTALISKVSGADKAISNLVNKASKNSPLRKLSPQNSNFLTAAIAEAKDEMPQSMWEQLVNNVVTKEYFDPSRKLDYKLGESGGTGLIIGALSGAGAKPAVAVADAATTVAGKVIEGTVKAGVATASTIPKIVENREQILKDTKDIGSKIIEKAPTIASAAARATVDKIKDIPVGIKESHIKNKAAKNNSVDDIEDPVLATKTLFEEEFIPEDPDDFAPYVQQVSSKIKEVQTKHDDVLNNIEDKKSEEYKQTKLNQDQELNDLNDKLIAVQQSKYNNDKVNIAATTLSNTDDVEVAKSSIDKILGAQKIEKASVEQSQAVLNSEYATEKQKKVAHTYIERKTQEEVHQDVLNGSDMFGGGKTHQARIDAAVNSGDKDAARTNLKDFKRFSDLHEQKQKDLTNVLTLIAKNLGKPTHHARDNAMAEYEAKYGFKLHKNSSQKDKVQNMYKKITGESAYLKAAYAESLAKATNIFVPTDTQQATSEEAAASAEASERVETTNEPIDKIKSIQNSEPDFYQDTDAYNDYETDLSASVQEAFDQGVTQEDLINAGVFDSAEDIASTVSEGREEVKSEDLPSDKDFAPDFTNQDHLDIAKVKQDIDSLYSSIDLVKEDLVKTKEQKDELINKHTTKLQENEQKLKDSGLTDKQISRIYKDFTNKRTDELLPDEYIGKKELPFDLLKAVSKYDNIDDVKAIGSHSKRFSKLAFAIQKYGKDNVIQGTERGEWYFRIKPSALKQDLGGEGYNQNVTNTVQEARNLYKQLKDMHGEKPPYKIKDLLDSITNSATELNNTNDPYDLLILKDVVKEAQDTYNSLTTIPKNAAFKDKSGNKILYTKYIENTKNSIENVDSILKSLKDCT